MGHGPWAPLRLCIEQLLCLEDAPCSFPPCSFSSIQEGSTSASFWLCPEESVAIKRGNNVKGWKVKKATQQLFSIREKPKTPTSPPVFAFHQVVTASVAQLNKNNSSDNTGLANPEKQRANLLECRFITVLDPGEMNNSGSLMAELQVF